MASINQNLDNVMPREAESFVELDLESIQIQPQNAPIGDSCLSECELLMNDAKDEYIKLRTTEASGLPYSAKLRIGDTYWKLHGEQRLVTFGSSYVAQVSVDRSDTLNSASDFGRAKDILICIVKTEKILVDQLLQKSFELVDSILLQLEKLANVSERCSKSGKLFVVLWRLLNKNSLDDGFHFCKDLCSDEYVFSKKLKVTFVMHSAVSAGLKNRSNLFKNNVWLEVHAKEVQLLKECLEAISVTHKLRLLESCSSQMKSDLENIDTVSCQLLEIADVQFFTDLEYAVEGTILEEKLPLIRRTFLETLVDKDLSKPVLNKIFLYVCRSLLDVVKLIQQKLEIEHVIRYEENELKMAIDFDSNASSQSMKCLLTELCMMVKLANHFRPGSCTANDIFPYKLKCKLLEDYVHPQSDKHVWICLIDATMVSIFDEDMNRIVEYFDVLEPLLQFILSHDCQESIRKLTHIILAFVAGVEAGQNMADKTILRKQSSVVGRIILENQIDFARVHSITRAFLRFWKQYNECKHQMLTKLPGKLFKPHLNEFRNIISRIVTCLLDKTLPLEDIVNFFKGLEMLLMDLSKLDLEWYVQVDQKHNRKTLLNKKIIIDSHQNQTEKSCYRVERKEYDKFQEMCAVESVPEHYQIKIVNRLLDCIEEVLQKQSWKCNTRLTERDQQNVAAKLISAIRCTLTYVNKQPYYADFHQFFEEFTKPFKHVIGNVESMDSVDARFVFIRDSFRFYQYQINMGIVEAIQRFSQLNLNYRNKHFLTKGFTSYYSEYRKLVSDYRELEESDKIRKIVHEVKRKLSTIQTDKWSTYFKQVIIPKVLACVGTVWSIISSKDFASTGKNLILHNIQVLSVLRMLCVDNDFKGVQRHLAQIPAGEGKSLIVAMIAAVLALVGYKVEIVCHSEYATKREEPMFYHLYRAFSVDSEISYKTFDCIVAEQTQILANKAWLHVCRSIGIPLPVLSKSNQTDSCDTALLINDIDYNSGIFYGKSSYSVFAPEITGLGLIQQKIWQLVETDCSDIEHQIEVFMRSSSEPEISELKSIIERPGMYKMISFNSSAAFEQEYTNETFFDAQFKKMISTAKDVYSRSQSNEYVDNFKLDANGAITCRDEQGEFHPNLFCQYVNAFIYFKLRKDNFVQNINGCVNFGYLYLDCSSFSYAEIPKKYATVLGVSSTPSGFRAIEDQYDIQEKSIIPSIFNRSGLKFDESQNFQCMSAINEWNNAIITRVKDIVKANGSVILIFSSEFEIDQLKKDLASQTDRFYKVSTESDTRSWICGITEVAVPGTIIAATRTMIHSMYQKAIEPIQQSLRAHVIQTFFSTDVQEETLFRQCIVRDGSHGCYELVVCLPHLVNLDLLDCNQKCEAVCYATLDRARKRIAAQAAKERMNDYKRAKGKHEKMIEFYDSI